MISKKKPLGLVATVVYTASTGMLCLLASLLFLLVGQTTGSSGLFISAGVFSCGFGVLALTSVYGLWSLQKWGKKLATGIFYAFIPLGIISIFPIWPKQEFTVANTVLQLIGIGISLLIIWYLSRPHICILFETE